jgi:hypothetical protein
VLSPAAVGQGYDDADVLSFFWDDAVSTFHADSYQNTNLDPQIDDPWPYWHEDAQDELVEWVYDSAANSGQVFQQPQDWYPEFTSVDDTADDWETWQFDSAANPGFVDIPPPDGWYDPDDAADEWDLWQADSAANPGFVDVPPPDGWPWDYPDDVGDDWETWQFDSQANSGFVDNPQPDAWPWDHADDIEDEPWWFIEDLTNTGFVDLPPADPWDFAFDDIDDEVVPDDVQLIDVVVATQPPDDAWWWDDDPGDDWESWQDDSQANSGFVDMPPADAWPWESADDTDDELAADEYVLEAFLTADQPPEDPFVEDDAGDDWWVDDYQLIDNNPALSLEDAWASDDLDAADPWEEWQFDSGVGPDNNPLLTLQLDPEWDEVDDELWWLDERPQDTFVAAQPPEDPWQEDDTADEWDWWLDAGTPADFTQAIGPDDPTWWDDDPGDDWEWWLDAVTPPDVAAPPPAALQPTDVRVQRPSRKNIRFKWGFPVERTAPGAVTDAKPAPQPSALLKKLLGRASTGIEATLITPASTPEKIAPAIISGPPEVSRETILRAIEEAAQREAERLRKEAAAAEELRRRVQAEEAEIRRLEADLAAARRRRKRREARLELVEQLARKRLAKIEASISVVRGRFDNIEHKLEEARKQSAVVAALHQKLARAAEKGNTRHIVSRIEEARQAETQLRGIHADLVDLQHAIGADLGHDRQLARLEREHGQAELTRLKARHREEIERLEADMRRQRSNLLAIQTAVQLLLDGD